MSLLKWKEQAARKTDLGKSINLVRETLKEKKIADELGQVGYEKMFRPITKGLRKIEPITIDRFAREQRLPGYQMAYEYPLEQDPGGERDVLNIGLAGDDENENYEIFDGVDLIQDVPEGEFTRETGYRGKKAEDEDEFFSLPEGSPISPQQAKQIQSPPSYSEGAVGGLPPPSFAESEFEKKRGKDSAEEIKVLKDLGLPLPTSRPRSQIMILYSEKIKEMGEKKRTLSRLKKNASPSQRETLAKEREKLDRQSMVLTRLRDSTKKGMGIRRRNGRGVPHLLKKLEVILGEIQAGNNSREMKRMGRAVLEILASQGVQLDVEKIRKML